MAKFFTESEIVFNLFKKMNSPYFTLSEMCEQFGCGKDVILRKVATGELPEFTIGSHGNKSPLKAWHKKILEKHADDMAEKYFD